MRCAVTLVPDAATFVAQATASLVTHLREGLDQRASVTLALSGGTTPRPVYEALARAEGIDWARVTIILVDERCVPSSDPQSNARLVRESLVAHLATAPGLLFPNTTLTPDACAADYAQRLHELLGDHPIDVAVLGLGTDGHTASLFPLLPEAAFGPAWALHTSTPHQAVTERISLSLAILQRARHHLVLTQGSEKWEVLQCVLDGAEDPMRWPLQAIIAAGQTTLLHQA